MKKSPERILFLTLKTFSFTGGIEKVCRVLCRALYDLSVKDLVEPKTFAMYDRTMDRDAKYLLKEQFRGFGGNRILYSLAALAEGLRSKKVILSHINLLFVALLIKRFSPKTKIILFVHGIEVWREIKKWKSDFLRNKCDEIWAVSQYTADQMVSLHKIKPERIRIVNNCLDRFLEIPTSFDKPKELLEKYHITSSQPVLFTLTRLSSSELYKGYDQVIRTIPGLLTQFPDLVYLIAGKADRTEKLRLEQLINEMSLQQHVRLLGFVPEEELTEHFLLADVFVMPSRKEGFGIVFIEAAACGCKTIAGNQDGSVDALLNGKLGMLVAPEDEKDITDAIRASLIEPKTAQSALAIQELAMTHFSYFTYKEKINSLLIGANNRN